MKYEVDREPYSVDIREQDGALAFEFVPKGLQHERGPGGAPARVPFYRMNARREKDAWVLTWLNTVDQPTAEQRQKMEDMALTRLRDRDEWMARLRDLMDKIEPILRKLGWSTRRIEKSVDDWYVGPHRPGAIVMQSDACKVMLEPVGSAAPGVEGVVDLYRMPEYDDIASFYYYKGAWHLHYMPHNQPPVESLLEAPSNPLSEDALRAVLDDMKAHAA